MANRLRIEPGTADRTTRKQVAIVALNSDGVIIRANSQARKALSRWGVEPEGMSLGECLAGVMTREVASTHVTIPGGDGEETLMLVLSEGQRERPQRPEPPQLSLVRDEPPPAPPAEAQLSPKSSVGDFIAHELRNPLNTILGISEILEDRLPSMPASESIAAISTIRSETERALIILKSLLLLAESRNKPAPVGQGRVPMHALARRVIAAHSRLYPDRQFIVRGDSPLFARGDSTWAELAMSNLVGNAEKYTPRDEPIEIDLRQNGSWVTAMVMDRGRGLNPEVYRSLWEVYSQGAEPEVMVSGSGIGLFLCKQLVQAMGGHVWAGRREAGGSAFTISLPVSFDMEVPPPLSTSLSQEAA